MLETQSTDAGHKNFIAVGTTINRGEDLAVKGAVSFMSSVLETDFIYCALDLYLRDS